MEEEKMKSNFFFFFFLRKTNSSHSIQKIKNREETYWRWRSCSLT